MYLKLTNDHTASFYNNESMNDESKECSKKPIPVKFNPGHYPDDRVSFCLLSVSDIDDDLRKSFLERFGVEMDKNVSKLQFRLYQDGDIGPCS